MDCAQKCHAERIAGIHQSINQSINQSNCTFIRHLLKSDFSQAPPTSMRAQTRQFLTIAWTVPVRCPRSLDWLSGKLFHTVGAETRKLLGPKRTVRVREMISSPWSADRSRTYRVPKLRNRRTNGHAENTKFPPASHTFGKHKNNCRRNITFINCCPCGK